MKILTMYLRAAKTELEEAGENAEGCANSVSELRSEIKQLTGVDIMLDENTFKSTYQIVKEISAVWDSLTDVTRANITDLMGGKRNANVIQALITNFDDAEKAMQAATSSAGSALAENEKYLDSIAGKLDLLQGKAQALAQGLIGSDILKFLLDIVNGLVDVANALQSINGLIPAIAAGVGAIVGHGLIRDVSKITQSVVAGLNIQNADFSLISRDATLAASALSNAQRNLLVQQLQNIAATDEQHREQLKSIASAIGLTQAENGLAGANATTAVSFKAITAAIPNWAFVVMGIGLAVSAVTMVTTAINNAKQAAIEAATETRDVFRETQSTFEKNANEIDQLAPRYRELSKRVGENGEQGKLTAEEYEEYCNILDRLQSISPGIVQGYDAERNAILKYKDAISGAREEQEKLYKTQRDEYLGNAELLFEDYNKAYTDAQQKMRTQGINAFFDLLLESPNRIDPVINALKSVGGIAQALTDDAIEGIRDGAYIFTSEELTAISDNIDEYIKVLEGATDAEGHLIFGSVSGNEALIRFSNSIKSQVTPNVENVRKEMENFRLVIADWAQAQSWFDPSQGWAQYYLNSLDEVVDRTNAAMSEANAKELYNDLQAAFENPFTKQYVNSYVELAEAVAKGAVSEEEFREKMASLQGAWGVFSTDVNRGNAVLSVFTSWLNSIAQTEAPAAAAAVEETTATARGLKDALEQLRNGYSLLEKAQAEMDTDGGLSLDTIRSIHDALEDGEKLTDYLYTEGNAVKLNSEAWEQRARSVAENDIAAKTQEIERLNALLISSRYNDKISTKEVEDAQKRIAELEAEISIYKATLEKPVDNDDPLNLKSMFEDIEKIKSDSSGLSKALEEVVGGTLINWNDLVSKYPELMEIPGLFDINTLEGQEQALRGLIDKNEHEIDAYINARIQLIKEAMVEAKAAGEDVTQYYVSLRNLYALRNGSSIDPVDGASANIESTLKKASSYAEVMKASMEGINLDFFTKMQSTFGDDWEKYTFKDKEGNILGVDITELERIIDSELEAVNASQQLKDAVHALFEEALGHKNPFEAMTDAMDDVDKLMNIVKELNENGFNSSVLEGLREFFGDDQKAYHAFVEMAKTDTEGFIAAMHEYATSLYEAAGATATETEVMQTEWAENTKPAVKTIEDLSKAVSEYKGAIESIADISSGKTRGIDVISEMLDLSKNSGVDINKLLQMRDGVLTANLGAARKAARSMMSWDKLKDIPNMTEDMAKAIRDETDAAIAATHANDALNNSLSAFSKAKDIISDIESGEADFFTTLQSVQEIANDTGASITDFFEIVRGNAYWDETAISDWAFGYIDQMVQLNQLTPKTAKYMKDLAAAEIEAAVASGRLNNVANRVTDAVGAVQGVNIDGRITYEQMQGLLEVSQDYANAIGFSNGQLTLNKKKFDETTNSVMKRARAEAQANIQLIKSDERYKELIHMEERHRHLNAEQRNDLSNFNAQIASWTALTAEIDNATSAYQNFLNADESVSGEQYTAAEKAIKVINETLYDNTSELFGRRGRDQFKKALDFVIRPDVKLNTKEFKAEWARLQRYTEENGKGLNNFIDDLVRKGIAKPLGNGMVQIDDTIDEISEKTGLATSFLQSMFEEWATYGGELNFTPVVDAEGQEETKSAFQVMQDNIAETKEALNDLSNGNVSVNTEEATKKLSDLKDKAASLSGQLDNINGTQIDIGTQVASNRLSTIAQTLSTIMNRLTALAKRGAITIRVNEVYSHYDEYPSSTAGGASSANVAMASGTANAIMGKFWKTKDHFGVPGGRTLVGELGRELVVNPETNRWYTVGDRGAEFVNLPHGALVFNAKQTRELLGKGSTSTRAGYSMVTGNAAAQVKGTSTTGSGNATNTRRIFVVQNRSTGYCKVVTGDYNACVREAKAFNANIIEDFTYSTYQSAVEYVKYMNQNVAEQKRQQEAAAAAARQKTTTTTTTVRNNVPVRQTQSTPSILPRNTAIRVPEDTGSSRGYNDGGYYGGDYGDYEEIEETIDPLDELVDLYRDLNDQLEHAIEHQKYYYDVANRAMSYDKMADSLSEQARLYKVRMETAQEGINQLLASGEETEGKRIRELEELYWDAHRSLYNVLDQINSLYVDNLDDKIDKVQSAYNDMKDAAETFEKSGAISVDQFQSLLDNGIAFMDYLDKVNGKYVVNKEAVEALVKAQKEQLAMESAMSYLRQIEEAMTDGSINKIYELANATGSISEQNWFNVTQMLAVLEESGKIPAQLMSTIRENVYKLRDLAGDVVMDIEDETENILDHLEDQQQALDKIVDLTEEMIKSEVNDHIDAIQKEVDLFREIVDLKKESLAATREEDSYQRDVNDKLKSITDLQTRIDKLSLDDSRTAQAERMSLMDELAGLQRELSDMQSDHSYDAQVESLDKMAEEYEKERQVEIDALEESISSSEKVFRLAVDRIETRWDELYNDLIKWNTETGSVLNSEIIDNWDLAFEAANKYGSYVEAMRGIHTELVANDKTNETLKYRVEDIFGKETLSRSGENADEISNKIADKVGDAVENVLDEYVSELGEISLGGGGVSGISQFLPKFHGGGVVGDEGAINDKEALAVLQKGEVVLDKDAKRSLFRLIDLKNYLSEKLRGGISEVASDIASAPRKLASMLGSVGGPAVAGGAYGSTFSPAITVNISAGGDVSAAAAKRFGETVADTALDKLYSTFERRGVGNIFSGKFKG